MCYPFFDTAKRLKMCPIGHKKCISERIARVIFLAYGVNENGELVHIDTAPRGRTALKCPYCGVPLVAKKGNINAPHFAHDGPTCAASISENAALPAFDKFDLHLPPKVLADLKAFARDGDDEKWNYRRLLSHDLIKQGYKGYSY